jgi:hypothetical protein
VSNRTENKERERVCVKIFKEAYSKFPQGKILDDENQEKPDFILLTKSGKIGIEVTSIVDRKQKRSESECEKVVLEARRIYEEQQLPNLHVSVHIGCESAFNKKNRSLFAKAIARQVIQNTPQPKSYIDLENKWNDSKNFPFEINNILIFNLPSLKQNHWHVPSGGFCREDFETELQGVLDEKETKILNYSLDCREQWLLVVAENMSASTFYEASEKTILHQYKSSFDKVFLLELFKGKLIQLKLLPNA